MAFSACQNKAFESVSFKSKKREHDMEAKYLAPGQGQLVHLLREPRIFKLTPAESGGAYLQFESRHAPGTGAPPHLHRDEDEAFYVLAGEYEFTRERFWAKVRHMGCPRSFLGEPSAYLPLPEARYFVGTKRNYEGMSVKAQGAIAPHSHGENKPQRRERKKVRAACEARV
jgi:quercetin dioxygenase-like cupin family protein